MLKVSNLTKTYSNNIVAIKELSFCLNKNKILGLVGPNGSGKTTTINSILNIIKFDHGDISLKGYTNNSLEFKKLVSYIPDELILPESLTGKEYINFMMSIYSVKKQTKLDNLIRLYNMQDLLNLLIKEYSHGMKKKITNNSCICIRKQIINSR